MSQYPIETDLPLTPYQTLCFLAVDLGAEPDSVSDPNEALIYCEAHRDRMDHDQKCAFDDSIEAIEAEDLAA